MASETIPVSGSKISAFNTESWVSKWNTRFDDGYIAEIFREGSLSSIFDGLQLSGRTINLTNKNPKWFEILPWEKTVKIQSAIGTGSSGATISLVVHTDHRDTAGNVPIQVGDGILIPGAYQTSRQDRIYVVDTYTAGTYTAVCKPLNNAGTVETASQMSVSLPAGTELKIHSNYFAVGTGQPKGSDTTRAVKSTKTQIIKTSMTVEGGLTSLKWREVKNSEGKTGLWLEGQELAEMNHDKKIDDALLVNEANDNATLVGTSQAGGSNVITSGLGYWNSADLYGSDVNYTSGAFDMGVLADYKDIALAQLIVASEITWYVGTDALRDAQEGGLKFIQSYSGGSDLFIASDKIGSDIRYFVSNGFTFRVQELKSWGNPLRYGNKNYDFSKRGLFVPEMYGNVEMDGGSSKRVPQLMVGYLEGRERVMSVQNGMTGRSNTNVVSQYDLDNMYMLTEMAPLAFRANMLSCYKAS
jgi:hypothetical protein